MSGDRDHTGFDGIVVRALGESDRQSWDRFVSTTPEASFFHLSGWKAVIERVCGHRARYFYSSRGQAITGVLPLVEVRSRLFGHSLISTPFCVYGGVAAETEGDRHALEERAVRLAEELGVDYLELRNIKRRPGAWKKKDLYVTFRKRISADDGENLLAIPRKQRAMIRKGVKAGLRSEIDQDVERFYRLYSISVRNLGTPVLAKRFFTALLEEFGDAIDILTVLLDGKPVSSVMSFYFRDHVLPYYGGGTALARETKANDFMYWELMRHAAARGTHVFDFGRSKMGTGSYSFKKHWGFEPQSLEYQYHLVRSTRVPDLSPMNPKYRALIGAWKRLPLWVTQAIGPIFARCLG